MRRALAVALWVALLLGATAVAASSITKARVGAVTLAPGSTRTVSVPYPDALKYGNARYAGVHVLRREPSSAGSPPLLAEVKILSAQSIEGGSLYSVRAHNANAPGTAPVELVVTARTVEPLPHR